MSRLIAVAIKNFGHGSRVFNIILEYLDLPDFVKQNIVKNIIPYLSAVELDGYDEYMIRKMMIIGNTSKFKHEQNVCFTLRDILS